MVNARTKLIEDIVQAASLYGEFDEYEKNDLECALSAILTRSRIAELTAGELNATERDEIRDAVKYAEYRTMPFFRAIVEAGGWAGTG